MISTDLSGATGFFDGAGPDYAKAAVAHRMLDERTGPGADFTGWLELPTRMLEGELKSVLSAAERIRGQSQVLVVVGIGGSYLGARAACELLGARPGAPEIVFAGNGLSPDRLTELVHNLEGKDFSINVVSKSGTTLEPALAFRVFRTLAEKKYGAAARRRIYATTDSSRGALKSMADSEGWTCFTVPDDVGGRYSVLSAVGLLPMAAAGIDVRRVLAAAAEELHALDLRSPENPAWQYAAARQHLYGLGRHTEVLAAWEPSFRYMSEWWKQLYGESEGKDGVGIYPASVEFSADLHSMGQYLQDGPRTLMETVVSFDSCNSEYKVPFALGDPDGLNYLAGMDFGRIARIAAQAVKDAHIAGGLPVMGVSAPSRSEEGFGELVGFFEMSCAISGYMSGVNPFDQPGVEAYKKNMFRQLREAGKVNNL